MSWKSNHMKKENMVEGIRTIVMVSTYEEAFKGVTWENIKDRFPGNQAYGATKFSDIEILAYWFKSNFSSSKAAKDVGYTVYYTDRIRHSTGAQPLYFRLARVNVKSFLNFLCGMISNNLLPEDYMVGILNCTCHKKRKGVGPGPGLLYKSKYYKWFAKRLVMEALSETKPYKKQTGKNEKTKVRQVAERFGVSLDTIRYWRDLETPNIMVRR
jgi:hypothetical protein